MDKKSVYSSDSQKNTIGYIVLIIIGGFLAYKTYPIAQMSTNGLAGFILGFFLALLGLLGFLSAFQIETTLDAEKRIVTILNKSNFSNKITYIPFDKIKEVWINTRYQKNLETYIITIVTKDLKYYQTGIWSFQQSDLFNQAQEMANIIGCPMTVRTKFKELTLNKVFVSFAGATLIYTIWYYLKFKQVCAAMWHGTAPILIIGLSFAFIFAFLRRHNLTKLF